ncbi:hypothetical protein DL93DRAFT_2087369 [Clavulina sp. PMI_390]|nr:hypothetical protein DL93DRAFT_2087369 [Clavulina sp. PMI_390]
MAQLEAVPLVELTRIILPEIHGEIVKYLNKADLRAYAQVSYGFYHEARPLIWRGVSFGDGEPHLRRLTRFSGSC